MKFIKDIGWTDEVLKDPVEDLLAAFTEGNHGSGQLEDVQHNQTIMAHALALVLVRLVEKGVVSKKDFNEIRGIYIEAKDG